MGVAAFLSTMKWTGTRRRHRVLRRLAVASALLLCAAITTGLVALGLSRLTPSWWTRVEAMGETSAAQAEALEAAALAQASLVRPGVRTGNLWQSEPWSVSLSESDANAWLGARLPRWVQSRAEEGGGRGWPRAVRDVRVVFHDDAVWLAAMVRDDTRDDTRDETRAETRDELDAAVPRSQASAAKTAQREEPGSVLSVAVRPAVDASGRLWVEARSVGVGRLTLPPMVLGSAREDPSSAPLLPGAIASRPEIAALLDMLAGGAPASVEPVLALADGRRVRLMAIHARDGRLELTCRTEARVPTP